MLVHDSWQGVGMVMCTDCVFITSSLSKDTARAL
jgi:hypothetical protein